VPDVRTIERLALDAGFELAGVAAAEPGVEDRRLAEWLDRGYHGDMGYMERRRDVRELLPGCRSVIALGVNYYVPAEHGPGPRVSRYAWGRDYHLTVGEMLEQLVPELERAHPGESFRAYCDTGPVLEKAWAQRAGIGWIGKNGCLISQRFGSWLFLAVILTTAELEPDEAHPDRCGSCGRCLASCPTDAFVSPGVIDARRCIPYLTIEQWKPIGADLKIAPHAFGCDACQEICPWNRKAADCGRADFAPRPGHANPDLREWVTMSKAEHRARFGDTPLARPGRRGLARNALAVLRETGLDGATLDAARNDRSDLVRKQADMLGA
jgi:epoxyqueuosine reductase